MYVLMACCWNVLPYQNMRVWCNYEVESKKKLAKKWKNQINGMENGLEKSKKCD